MHHADDDSDDDDSGTLGHTKALKTAPCDSQMFFDSKLAFAELYMGVSPN